jgi:hypothetical protein
LHESLDSALVPHGVNSGNLQAGIGDGAAASCTRAGE